MIPLLDRRIPQEDWLLKASEKNGYSAPSSRLAGVTWEPHTLSDAGPWEPAIEKILTFQHLGDDWDGFGAKAPSDEVLVSAIGLAKLLLQQGVDPPARVVSGLEGEISFEWQYPDGTYLDIEIVRWLFAEVMLIEPGMPAKHWTLPTE